MAKLKQAKQEADWDIFIKTFISFLKSKDLKYTGQRQALAEWVFKHPEHFTADDLVIAFQENRWVSKATIYRTLSLMVEAGLLEEEDFNEGYKTYEIKFNRAHHDHLICIKCNKVIEFENREIEKIQEKIAGENGFILESHTLKLFGICPSCQKKKGKRKSL